MKINFELEKLLNAREERDRFEKKILTENKNSSLITLRANYPGSNKNTFYAHAISYFNFLQLKKKINCKKIFHMLNSEGLIFFIITDSDSLNIKRKTISIEENFFLGRLADIDVQNIKQLFSRTDLNLPARKCLICEKRAVLCVRSRNHSTEEILKLMHSRIENFLFKGRTKTQILANIIRVSMLEELCRFYSFGCVNVNSRGSHDDMNFLLMLKGIDLVSKSIASLTPEDIKNFSALRQHGIVFEKKLFEVCNGVNTYKGAHFLLLILAAAVLQVKNFFELSKWISEFSLLCLEDLNLKSKPAELKNLGIRGEALLGFKDHFNIFLPLLEKGASNDELSLKILTRTFDTTTIKRGGLEKLKHIQLLAAKATSSRKIQKLNTYCVENNLSTGGVADNFIITYALYLIKKYFYDLPK